MEVEASILLGLGRMRWDGREAEAAGSCGTELQRRSLVVNEHLRPRQGYCGFAES